MSTEENGLPKKLPRSCGEMTTDSPPFQEAAEHIIPELSDILDNDKNCAPQYVNPYYNTAETSLQRSDQTKTVNPVYFEPEKCLELTQPAVTYRNVDRPQSNIQIHGSEQLKQPYNTWKSKNTLALNTITSSSRETASSSTGHNTSSRRGSSPGRKQVKTHKTNNGDVNYSRINKPSFPHPPYDQQFTNNYGNPSFQNENIPPMYHPNTGQYNIQPPEHLCNQILSQSNKCPDEDQSYHGKDVDKFSQTNQGRMQPLPFRSSSQDNSYHLRQQILPTNTGRRKTCRSNFDNNYEDCNDNCGRRSLNVLEPGHREPTNDLIRHSEPKINVISPFEIAQVKKDTIVDLYNIIRLQNEQILMLQQQVNQVLQLHLDCNKSVKENQSCQCSQKKFDGDMRNKISQTDEVKTYLNENTCTQKIGPVAQNTKCNNVSKHSVGVMTSCIDGSNVMPFSNANKMATNPKKQELDRKSKRHQEDTKSQRELTDGKLKPHSQESCSCRGCCQKYPIIKQKRGITDEKTHQHYTSTPAGQDTTKGANLQQVDNSLCLNEAEIVVANESEVYDADFANSVHIDLEQYYSTPASSSSVTSSSSEEESDREQSSDSWPGPGEQAYTRHKPEDGARPAWAFYDQQNAHQSTRKVNLHHQEKSKRSRGQPVYNGNRPYEAENWSKRVTFDGPFVEESGNISNVIGFQQCQRDQLDTRSGAPNRIQDMRMYNMANGNTNHSFATLRYFERYQLIPPQIGTDVADHSVHNSHKGRRQSKKKKKSSIYKEKYPCTAKNNHKK